ncbi:MAG: helix-turn-helix domain-containing protein [Clostridia bacterium]|nr:helix-turn-helix domain-containing protein [Clostridia bacterium]
MKILATRLKELRTEKQLSLDRLGKIIGVSDTAIMKWEQDKSEPTALNIKQLAIFFNTSADYLLGLEDESGGKTYGKYHIGTINNNGKMEIK